MPRPQKGVKRRRVDYERKKKKTYPRRRELILGGFPKTKMVKLRYVQIVPLDATVATPSVQVFSANSMYDPYYTGTGHQPANFDRWTPIYDHYSVLGSKITVNFVPNTTSNVAPCIVGIAVSDNGSTVANTSTEDILERKLVVSNKQSVGINNSMLGLKPLSHTFSASQFFGKPKAAIVGDGAYRGRMGNLGVGSNPSEQAFYEVFATNISGNDPGAIHVVVTIDYIAVLTEPKEDEAS